MVTEIIFYKSLKNLNRENIKVLIKKLATAPTWPAKRYAEITENFSESINPESGKNFGKKGQLTFELYREGTFLIDGKSGFAWEKSKSYRDSAFIRSTKKLPQTYKISIVVGEIDYDYEKVEALPQDPEYPEGPKNENGCYLLSIMDEKPTGHHTNTWWHQHRKLVIDVDNNVWGHGMPHPIFMVYFDKNNHLNSWDEMTQSWQGEWQKALTYSPDAWYRIEVEKTDKQFILRVYDDKEKLLQEAKIDLDDIWHADEFHGDYFVVGDPHENYYQGSMKIKSISMSITK